MAIVRSLVGDTLLLDKTSLSANLGSDVVVRQTGSGENGDLLSTGDRVHRVNGGDTGRDHLFGVFLSWSALNFERALGNTYSGEGVDGVSVNVEVVLSQDLGALVDGTT
jgi:hypothetical protein